MKSLGIISVLPFNSVFSAPRIAALVHYATRHYDAVQLLVPERSSRYIEVALGKTGPSKSLAAECSRLRKTYDQEVSLLPFEDQKRCSYAPVDDVMTKHPIFLRERELFFHLSNHHHMRRSHIIDEASAILRKRLDREKKVNRIVTEQAAQVAGLHLLEHLAFFSCLPFMESYKGYWPMKIIFHRDDRLMSSFIKGSYDSVDRSKETS